MDGSPIFVLVIVWVVLLSSPDYENICCSQGMCLYVSIVSTTTTILFHAINSQSIQPFNTGFRLTFSKDCSEHSIDIQCNASALKQAAFQIV